MERPAGFSNLLSWLTQEGGEQIAGARKAERNKASRGGRAAETTGGESFGRSLRRSNDSPEGAAARADRRRANRGPSTEEARAIRIPHLVVLTSYIIVL